MTFFESLQLIFSGGTLVALVVSAIRLGRALEKLDNHDIQITKLWKAHEGIIERLLDMRQQ